MWSGLVLPVCNKTLTVTLKVLASLLFCYPSRRDLVMFGPGGMACRGAF